MAQEFIYPTKCSYNEQKERLHGLYLLILKSTDNVLKCVKNGGTVTQIGANPSDDNVRTASNNISTREISFSVTFQHYHSDYSRAIDLMSRGRIDAHKLIINWTFLRNSPVFSETLLYGGQGQNRALNPSISSFLPHCGLYIYFAPSFAIYPLVYFYIRSQKVQTKKVSSDSRRKHHTE
ncbi:hypothetical protein GRS66_007266 [Saccharomyces pastorianus]|uniref:Uncharacterized protein n=1 Tax=Saccharomyces pastorianus TaxID=27292 RepID=A0A6C1E605_SACPS|nr:hypothetical protein GRS66_007266 [Saccharomyces pastorianus]